MQGSKITLSPAELALFCNAEIILTKNRIIQKTIQLLAEVQDEITAIQNPNFAPTPKISKGENYLGLPYVVLDYPRISKGEDLFFIRSMFWWGNFFSSTLQLAGQYKEKSIDKLIAAYETLAAQNFFIGIHEDPWQHHFEETNYSAISSLSKKQYEEILQQQSHIKIAARWPLSEWDRAAGLLTDSWRTLVGLIA